MLKELFPRVHARFSSLPLLGSIADPFTDWLHQQGYRRGSNRHYVRALSCPILPPEIRPISAARPRRGWLSDRLFFS
jgi:hypothetical protein